MFKLAIFFLLISLFRNTTCIPKLLFNGTDQTKPGLGINLGPIDSGMIQPVFTNLFKHAREWRPCASNDNWTTFGWTGDFTTEWSTDGYPLNFTHNPYGTSRVGYMTEFGTYGKYQTGDYMVTFKGTGKLVVLGDAKDFRRINSNRYEFMINETTTKGIVVIVTEPNVTEIDVRLKSDEYSNETFNIYFLNAIQQFEALRFSSWMINRKGDNNPNANINWENRRQPTYFTQHGKQMVSIEYIVELANELMKDIWISIPSSASNNFIIKTAEYIKNNIGNETKKIYVEQSSSKGFNNNNRTLQMALINAWKSVFGNDQRVKYVLSTWLNGYFENTISMYTDDDLKQFHAYSVSGEISYGIETNFDSYNVSKSENFTVNDIIDMIRQEIYKDELSLIYLVQKVTIKMNVPVIGYNVGFNVHAPGFLNRWKKNNDSLFKEQSLEDLIIEAQRQPIVEDLYLDFFERWYRVGAGIMFMSSFIDYVDRCENGGGKCGYVGLLENSLQVPDTVPKYKATTKWINGEKGKLPFTSADVVKNSTLFNCTNCLWGTCNNGTCVCFDGYSGINCDQLGEKYLDCHSNITEYGVNINGIPDWSTELTFIDLQRRARKWIVHKIVFTTAWAELNQDDIQLRDDGYPLYLETGKTIGTFLTRDLNARFPNGDYVCLYDGDGALEFLFNDVKITKRGPGRIEMTVNHKTEMNNGIYYNIIRTNPSDPIRNIRLFELRFEHLYEKFPFHPAFLEFMKKFKTIRFMPWSNINTDELIDWTNRTTDSFYTFNLKTGVSLEKQVLLLNTLGANGWFNLPHRATDYYVKNWAYYLKDNLRPDVKIYIEVGNECWGSGGPHECGNYAQKMGFAENETISKNQNLYGIELQGRICYHAKTGKRYLDIVKNVFGSSYNKDRIKLVFGAQAAWSGPLEIFYLCNGNYSQSYDVIAIAPYISADMKKSDGTLVTVDEFFNKTIYEGIQNSIEAFKNIKNLVNNTTPHMELAFYEAGPDFSSLFDTSNLELTELSIAVHRDQRMYDALRLYFENLTSIDGYNLKAYLHFNSVGKYTKYGCWGLMESSDTDLNESPKYKAYIDHIDSLKTCTWTEKIDVCQNNCSFKGICGYNALTQSKDTCTCYFGNVGEACENLNYIKSERCTYQCNGKGECKYNHTEGFYLIHACHCLPGYYGYGCELFDCPNECNYNGLCVDNDTCSCYNGFKGKYCDIDCGCNNRGVCSNTTNQCICDRGYSLFNGKCELNCLIDSDRTECLSCPDCVNGDCIRGKCVCWAGYTLDISKSCTIKTSSVNDGSKIGVNLNGVVDWSTQWAFVDIGKQARNWIIQHMDKLNDLYIWSLNENFTLNSDRYPSYVPYQRKFVTLMLRDVKQHWPNSIYHVFYDGEGEIDFGFDAKVIERKYKNRMKISVNLSLIRENGVLMIIRKINPANPLRNIRIVMDGFQDTYEQNPFHPLFLERLSNFKTIRFMPWTQEKNLVSWKDRINTTTFTQGSGVAYEYQIHLCNKLKTNPWFIVPYAADDEFVTELAKLILNNLRKDLNIYVEYTNEAWNDFFESGKYCIKKGIELGFSNDSVEARNLYYSHRSKQIIEIFKNVFNQESDRVTHVLGSFILMPVMSERILTHNNVYQSHSNIMLAITGYISCGSPSPASVSNSDLSVLFSGCTSDIPNIKRATEVHLNISIKYNIKFGMYESGSGFSELEAIFSGYETPGATDKYIAFHRDSRIYNVYTDYYRMFNQFNLTENCHYAYVEQPSKYGPWHLLEYQNQSLSEAHRYRAIMDIINETKGEVEEIKPITCNGLLQNDINVCDKKGICLAQDQCDPYPIPTRTNDIIISPLTAKSIVDYISISTTKWKSILPVKYAFAFKLGDGSFAMLSEFMDNPSTFTFLPYTGYELKIVLLVLDELGNVYYEESPQLVTVNKFDGTLEELLNLTSKYDSIQKAIVFYDISIDQANLTQALINDIQLTSDDFVNGLNELDDLVSKIEGQETVFKEISKVIDDLFKNLDDALGTSKTDFNMNELNSISSVLSNMYDNGSPDLAEDLVSDFSKLLSKSEMSNTTDVDGLSSVIISTKSFTMSVANINLSTVTNQSYVKYSSISANLNEIFTGMNSSSKVSISLVNYPKDTKQSIISSQLDLNFLQNGTILSVNNLNNPIKLEFELDNQTSAAITDPPNQIECSFYNEATKKWDNKDCSFFSYDKINKKVTCSCSHATKFGIAQKKNSGSVNIVAQDTTTKAETINIKNESISKIRNKNELIFYLYLAILIAKIVNF